MSKAKGTRAEHRTMRVLEAAGYACTRAAASLGLFDVIAVGPGDVRLVQCKAGKHPWLSPAEREALVLFAVPPNVRKELWKWRDYAREPEIEVL
jgi:Holliday junction resolvase